MEYKEIFRSLADNPQLCDALMTFLESKFEDMHGTGTADGMSDEILGQMLRARLIGKAKIREAFIEIARYKSVQDKKDAVNRAR